MRNVRALLICLFTAASASQLHADEDVFTQVPEAAPSQLPDSEQDAETPQPASDLLKRGPKPAWIWGADPNAKYVLKKTFQGEFKAGRLQVSCDNHVTLRVNGKQVAQSGEWQQPVEVDVTKHLNKGENELLAEVRNAGGPSGFVMKLGLERADGKRQYVVSDKSWQVAASQDAKTWSAAKELHSYGAGPWGEVFAQAAPTGGTPRGVFELLPGFQVERLFTVPKEKLGSWVSITFDDKGRLLASDQGGKGICRVTPPPIGSNEPTQIEHLDVEITSAQGMLYAFDSLYLSVNGGPGSGLYRARDTDGDDQFDEVVKLKALQGGGEHGPHALRLSPDGQSIYLIAGNHTNPPVEFDHSRVPDNWGEDLLLPRQWDARGHARGRLAPGGWIAKTDPEGKTWEIVSTGYRNTYDFAFNADGEIFAYDADMEWDMGTPWYRPTRVVHATSGSDFGWRSGTGKWPTYYVDSLPELVNIGPGSPVGVEFGYGTKFPAKYQKALYLCDWTFGTMYAVHIEPDGASYKATKEEFLSRTPLPLTDVAVGPDGALYFTIGGRGTQSELFRVTYVGDEPTEPVDPANARDKQARELRRSLEALHQPRSATDVGRVIAQLGNKDRHIRYAARVALEHQPVASWQAAVLGSKDPQTLITGAVALARQGDSVLAPKLLAALDAIALGALPEATQLELLRAYQLVFIRMGPPHEAAKARLAETFDAFYPAKSDNLNRELSRLLVYLESPTVVAKTIPLLEKKSEIVQSDLADVIARNQGYGRTVAAMLENAPDRQQIHYAFVLRNVKKGWTLPQRKAYFQWFDKARQWKGGASFEGFLRNIDNEAFANCTDAERLAIEALGARTPYKAPKLPKPQGPGKKWTTAELLAKAQTELKGRDFKNGKKMFSAARCVVCHRFAGEGGATGPDLTQLAGRFNAKDLIESMTEPSKVVSDQYRASKVQTLTGKVHTGQIVSETETTLILVVDPEDATKTVEIKKDDVDEIVPSEISLMPKDLLDPLNEDEVLDLLAYLLSRGNPRDGMFRRR